MQKKSLQRQPVTYTRAWVKSLILFCCMHVTVLAVKAQQTCTSAWVQLNSKGQMLYTADERGNTLPDFSKVGYQHSEKAIPLVPVVKTITASPQAEQDIQQAIDELSKQPLGRNGFRGAILLKAGTYPIAGTLHIQASGIVLRGEGNNTKLIATGKGQRNLIAVSGTGQLQATGSKIDITDTYVPVGAHSFTVAWAKGLRKGDKIIVYRPATKQWITDLQMDRIEVRDTGTQQWQPEQFNLLFERTITRIHNNTLYIDNPIVMAMERQYGGGQVYTYSFNGRIENVGIENLYCESAFAADTDEDHGWNAVTMGKIENGWVKKVTARYFGYACVNLGSSAKNITVDSCQCRDAKSQVTGGRRYSFNNDGQQNLFMNCFTSEGRHDYVTGARVCGPNVFYNCRAQQTHADIGPHHRWATGTLYDNILTDGDINIQDRGNWGTGHGWVGVTQVVWNCTAAKAAIQDPWVSGRNYVFNLQARRYAGRLAGRPQTPWEDCGQTPPAIPSLFRAQQAQHSSTTLITTP
jgi:hypothetical protein